MAGNLVSAVFASALPGWLKLYAAALASYAATDGSRVFPSVKTLARNVNRSDRQVQTALRALRFRGILTIEVPPGKHRATRYRFHVERLPQEGDGQQLALFPRLTRRNLLANGETQGFPHESQSIQAQKTRFPQSAQASTGNPLHPSPEVGFTRSVNRSVSFNTRTGRFEHDAKARKTG